MKKLEVLLPTRVSTSYQNVPWNHGNSDSWLLHVDNFGMSEDIKSIQKGLFEWLSLEHQVEKSGKRGKRQPLGNSSLGLEETQGARKKEQLLPPC